MRLTIVNDSAAPTPAPLRDEGATNNRFRMPCPPSPPPGVRSPVTVIGDGAHARVAFAPQARPRDGSRPLGNKALRRRGHDTLTSPNPSSEYRTPKFNGFRLLSWVISPML